MALIWNHVPDKEAMKFKVDGATFFLYEDLVYSDGGDDVGSIDHFDAETITDVEVIA